MGSPIGPNMVSHLIISVQPDALYGETIKANCEIVLNNGRNVKIDILGPDLLSLVDKIKAIAADRILAYKVDRDGNYAGVLEDDEKANFFAKLEENRAFIFEKDPAKRILNAAFGINDVPDANDNQRKKSKCTIL